MFSSHFVSKDTYRYIKPNLYIPIVPSLFYSIYTPHPTDNYECHVTMYSFSTFMRSPPSESPRYTLKLTLIYLCIAFEINIFSLATCF